MRLALLTGFPGFIGERLVPRLLALQPDLTLVCLVQERFLEAARSALDALQSSHPALRSRVRLETGDITLPDLGLAAGAGRELKAGLYAAYHLAAAYDLAVSRELGERVNVQGTRRVLDFVSEAPGLDRLHYVSTAYVSGRAVGVFRERDLDVGQSFRNHYEETKFLAEVAVRKSGVPATVYRPAIVVGDSRTGETAKFDGPYFVLSAMERLPSPGVFFRIGSGRNPTNLVPVDFVIEALARLASIASSRGRTYHLVDPEPPATLEVVRLFARALGRSYVYLPAPVALARAALAAGPIQRWLGIPVEALEYFDHPCRYDTTHASSDLQALGIRCPALHEYVDRLVAFYLTRKGSLRRAAMV